MSDLPDLRLIDDDILLYQVSQYLPYESLRNLSLTNRSVLPLLHQSSLGLTEEDQDTIRLARQRYTRNLTEKPVVFTLSDYPWQFVVKELVTFDQAPTGHIVVGLATRGETPEQAITRSTTTNSRWAIVYQFDLGKLLRLTFRPHVSISFEKGEMVTQDKGKIIGPVEKINNYHRAGLGVLNDRLVYSDGQGLSYQLGVVHDYSLPVTRLGIGPSRSRSVSYHVTLTYGTNIQVKRLSPYQNESLIVDGLVTTQPTYYRHGLAFDREGVRLVDPNQLSFGVKEKSQPLPYLDILYYLQDRFNLRLDKDLVSALAYYFEE